jgi:hypothetical protein
MSGSVVKAALPMSTRFTYEISIQILLIAVA